MKTQSKELMAIASLRYQLERYRLMGNGFMCQQVSSKLRTLTKGM